MSEKTEQPTARKLEKAREKGQVAKSQKVTLISSGIGSLIGFVLAVSIAGPVVKEVFLLIIETAANSKRASDIIMLAGYAVLVASLPVIVGGLLGSTIGTFAQTRGLISFEALTPKPEALLGMSFFKRLVSPKSVIEMCQMIVFSTAFIVLSYYIFIETLTQWRTAYGIDSTTLLALLNKLIFRVIGMFLGLGLVLAILDFCYQYFQFRKDQKMSKDEVKREYKESEGDPMIKGIRRQLAREIANSPMRKAVKNASMVITNPSHVAIVVLHNSENPVPVVTYKAVDDGALEVRRFAYSSQIPVFESRLLARYLLANVQEGNKVPRSKFKDVAKLLAKANAIREARNPRNFDPIRVSIKPD